MLVLTCERKRETERKTEMRERERGVIKIRRIDERVKMSRKKKIKRAKE